MVVFSQPPKLMFNNSLVGSIVTANLTFIFFLFLCITDLLAVNSAVLAQLAVLDAIDLHRAGNAKQPAHILDVTTSSRQFTSLGLYYYQIVGL